MKKWLSAIIVLLLISMTACEAGRENVPHSTDQEIQQSSDPAGEVIPTEEQTKADSGRKEGQLYFSSKMFTANTYYPAYAVDIFHPMTAAPSSKTKELPDTVNSFEGIEDSFDGETLRIGALNCSLRIPEGYYWYKIPGQYYDSLNREAVTLNFVNEYVFTSVDVGREKLIEDIRSFYEQEHIWKALDTRGPGYVIFSFRVFLKQYLPIENLFTTLLADTGEYFTSGNYYCSMGRRMWGGSEYYGYYQTKFPESLKPELLGHNDLEELSALRLAIPYADFPVEQWISELVGATGHHGIYTESMVEPLMTDQGGPFMYGSSCLFRSGMASYYADPIRYSPGMIRYTIKAPNIAASIFSSEWAELWEYAKNELREHPDRYAYPEIEIDLSEETIPGGGEEAASQDRLLRTGWKQDAAGDQELRAFIFASIRTFRDVSLRDVIILTRDTESGTRLYIALRRVPTSEGLVFIDKGWNALDETDFGFAKDYIEKEL